MLLSFLFSLIIFILLKINFAIIEGEIIVYLATSEYNNNIIMIFNIFHEFMFDKTIYVKYIDLEEYLNKELTNFYTKTISTIKILHKYRKYFTKVFDDLYDSIQNSDLCSYSQEFFNTTITEEWRTCRNISDNSAHFGLSILIPFLLEEMKEMKAKFSQKMNLIKSYGFLYNNTLYGIDLHVQFSASLNEEEMKLYNQLDSFRFFNTINHDNIISLISIYEYFIFGI